MARKPGISPYPHPEFHNNITILSNTCMAYGLVTHCYIYGYNSVEGLTELFAVAQETIQPI